MSYILLAALLRLTTRLSGTSRYSTTNDTRSRTTAIAIMQAAIIAQIKETASVDESENRNGSLRNGETRASIRGDFQLMTPCRRN
jgi:hypothetical protein